MQSVQKIESWFVKSEVKLSWLFMVAWSSSYLSGYTKGVVFSSFQSREIFVNSGVLQTSYLGSLLFLLFVTDLSEYFKEFNEAFSSKSLLYFSFFILHTMSIFFNLFNAASNCLLFGWDPAFALPGYENFIDLSILGRRGEMLRLRICVN